MNNNLTAGLGGSAEVKYSVAPDYRKVVPGLNLDCKCDACNKNVIVQIGMSPEEGFSLSTVMLEVKCTLCKTPVPPRSS